MAVQLADITRKMLKRLPYWFKMRKDPESIGAQFLNVVGLELEEINALLDYATQQFYIGTVDLGQVDQVYKATIPIIPDGFAVRVYGGPFELEQAPNMTEFLTALSTDRLHNPEIYYENPYCLDLERRVLYVRQPYGADQMPPFGFVTLVVTDQNGRTVTTEELPLTLHPVWNFLDEFGLLLDTPRLYGERNHEYKERLLAVFQYPANSSRQGLLNALVRELSQIATVQWDDPTQDLALPHSRVIPETIRVDGESWPADKSYEDSSGRMILKGDPDMAGRVRTVRYGYGVAIYSLTDKRQTQFQKELWTARGHATERLRFYADLIEKQVPINWGQFLWDQGFWDIAEADVHAGVLPAFCDASVAGWRAYSDS